MNTVQWWPEFPGAECGLSLADFGPEPPDSLTEILSWTALLLDARTVSCAASCLDAVEKLARRVPDDTPARDAAAHLVEVLQDRVGVTVALTSTQP